MLFVGYHILYISIAFSTRSAGYRPKSGSGMHATHVFAREAAPVRHETRVRRRWLRCLHRDDLAVGSALQSNSSSGCECLLDTGMCNARMCSDHSGRHRKHTHPSSSCPGTIGQGTWFAMWILHARHCDVHVRIIAEFESAIDAGSRGGFPGQSMSLHWL